MNKYVNVSKTLHYKWCKENFGEQILVSSTSENEQESFYIMTEHQWDYWYSFEGGFNFFFRNENDAALFKLWFC